MAPLFWCLFCCLLHLRSEDLFDEAFAPWMHCYSAKPPWPSADADRIIVLMIYVFIVRMLYKVSLTVGIVLRNLQTPAFQRLPVASTLLFKIKKTHCSTTLYSISIIFRTWDTDFWGCVGWLDEETNSRCTKCCPSTCWRWSSASAFASLEAEINSIQCFFPAKIGLDEDWMKIEYREIE